MAPLLVAAAFFVGIHLLVAGTRARDLLVRRMGEGAYLGAFSLASLVGLVALVLGYRTAFASGNVMVWGLGPAVRHAAGPVMLVALLFAVVGLTSPSPTAVGTGERLERNPEPTGIQRITRHPFLWGVATWAGLHLAANGDRASIVLFGSLLVVSLAGTASIDRKRSRQLGEVWERYARATSNVPFAAILTRRSRLAIREIGWWRIALALVVFGAVVAAHPWLFGAYPLPGMDD